MLWFSSVEPDRPVELKRIFDHLADQKAKRRYREPRRSSGQWGTMHEPPTLIDRTGIRKFHDTNFNILFRKNYDTEFKFQRYKIDNLIQLLNPF